MVQLIMEFFRYKIEFYYVFKFIVTKFYLNEKPGVNRKKERVIWKKEKSTE